MVDTVKDIRLMVSNSDGVFKEGFLRAVNIYLEDLKYVSLNAILKAFGNEVARWAEWWQSHFNKPREAWLVEGMRHQDANVRRIAAREFQLLTGKVSPTESGATPEQSGTQPQA